ncbi:hypothetical protein FSARC_8443 [Fusarium sarcochroum]|uniref:Uncharacterized protein n=1 Tax=Fusarium sarcochroum TaxID=1208366 RepID=A0A8H4X6C7_9HYPO|nr:hypothetical protein FSARC_8443 [Fusarium sarcochroum]
MASLPSYQDAVSADWLHIVAPYISHQDFPSLCRVSRRFWETFAPRIWGTIPRSDRVTGGDSEDDLALLFSSVFNRLSGSRSETRSLVRIFDARSTTGTYSLNMGSNLSSRLKDAIRFLPNLSYFLVDGHEDLDPSEFLSEAGHQALLLSMADCPLSLSVKFVASLRGLVYLDLSRVLGSLRPLFQLDTLPELRVLKLQGKEVDDATIESLTAHFETRLWSLDLSNNKLTDQALEHIGGRCLWPADLRSDVNFDVEGKLELGSISPEYGTWIRIIESQWSGSFSHPNRHLVDAPSYDLHDTLPQEFVHKRLDGKTSIKSDSADAVCRGLQGEDPQLPPASFQASQGLTHLNLSDNQISSLGVRKLLTLCRGHFQQFSCDSMLLVPPSKPTAGVWPRTAKLYGFFAAHTLRPVFSSNLRVVRLHHSVVTRIPTLELEGLSTMARLYISESSILPRAEKAFPEAFVPDMNPRITSLTLTRIPRRSSGPLVDKLVSFLKLLSTQERAIFDASSRRGPSVLAGLRHLRLEFEQDPYGEDSSIAEDIDAEELLNSGDTGFSFFGDGAAEPRSTRETADSARRPGSTNSSPSQGGLGQYELGYLEIDILLDEKPTKTQVWIGPKESDNPVIQDYRKLALHNQIRDHVGPAIPAQVLAGVPSSALVFHTAWCMAIMPPKIKEPVRTELEGMQDVLAELKRFRLDGRAKYLKLQREFGSRVVPPGPPHGFWLGRLEVSTQQVAPRSKAANYWR